MNGQKPGVYHLAMEGTVAVLDRADDLAVGIQTLHAHQTIRKAFGRATGSDIDALQDQTAFNIRERAGRRKQKPIKAYGTVGTFDHASVNQSTRTQS